jgi:hypothetical protein
MYERELDVYSLVTIMFGTGKRAPELPLAAV